MSGLYQYPVVRGIRVVWIDGDESMYDVAVMFGMPNAPVTDHFV